MNDHAEQIKVERQQMEFNGQTRSQARASIYAGKIMADFQSRLRKEESSAKPVNLNVPFKMDIQTTALPSTPILSGGIAGKETPGGGSSSEPPTLTLLEDVIVVINGTGYYTNLYTDGRLDTI